jgi:signal transduction histidine kinase
MSIKSRIAILLALLLLGFAATIGIVRWRERRTAAENIEAARAAQAQLASHWFDVASKALPLFAADAAQSAELSDAVSRGDWNAVRSVLEVAIERAGLSAAWVISDAGKVEIQVGTLLPPAIAPGEFAALVNETPRPRFFLGQNGVVAEVAARKLRAADGTPGAMWILVARRWDESYLRMLGLAMESVVTITPPISAGAATDRADDVVLVRPLEDWAGRTIASARIEHVLAVPERLPPLQTWTFVAFGLAFLAATVIALERWVVRPLERIRESLARDDVALVAPLTEDRSELGRIARLVRSSFEQRGALAREVEERKRAQHELERSEAELRESMEERVRLGRDLHDGVIQSLYAAGMGIAGIRPLLQPEQTEAAARIEQARAALNETIHDVRNFIVGLEPESLKTQSFTQAVGRLLEIMQAIRPVETSVTIDEAIASRLSLSQRVNALQIAREAVSNALRHGNANRIFITLRPREHFAEFEIVDDGQGFDVSAAGPGRGLANFAERARELGGELVVDSALQRGTTVKLTFSFHP